MKKKTMAADVADKYIADGVKTISLGMNILQTVVDSLGPECIEKKARIGKMIMDIKRAIK